jgi:hypothetical protein
VEVIQYIYNIYNFIIFSHYHNGILIAKDFFELVKAIGESKSKQEEDRIIADEAIFFLSAINFLFIIKCYINRIGAVLEKDYSTDWFA